MADHNQGPGSGGDAPSEPLAQPKVKNRVGTFGFEDPDALPFAIEFREVLPVRGAPPRLHSFQHATVDSGHWLMIGGRGAGPKATADEIGMTGEHTFLPSSVPHAQNFPVLSFSADIWVYHPETGESAQFDTNRLPRCLGAPLQSTSQQSWYDEDTGYLWILGGYGWDEDQTTMCTFDTLIRVHAPTLVKKILEYAPAEEITDLFEMLRDDRIAVTGGELVKVGDVFYLVFGQTFQGQYFAFGDQADRPQQQVYTEEIRAIEMVPGQFEILDVSSMAQGDPSEFHRRDLNVKKARDAATGETVVVAYGGVFKDGGPLGFLSPIVFHPDERTIDVRFDAIQLFNGYATATIGIWSDRAESMSQLFFGGIGHGVYHTHGQKKGLDNDGMPYGSDVSVLMQRKDDTWQEYVLPKPVPRNQLLAANGAFFVHPDIKKAGLVMDEEVLLVDGLPTDEPTLVGWIYGGIDADLPQPPKNPAEGDAVPTRATDKVFEVWLKPGTSGAIPVLK